MISALTYVRLIRFYSTFTVLIVVRQCPPMLLGPPMSGPPISALPLTLPFDNSQTGCWAASKIGHLFPMNKSLSFVIR